MVKKKILFDFNNFGVKWSALDRVIATKKLEVKILILAKVMDKWILKKSRFTGGCCESENLKSYFVHNFGKD